MFFGSQTLEKILIRRTDRNIKNTEMYNLSEFKASLEKIVRNLDQILQIKDFK